MTIDTRIGVTLYGGPMNGRKVEITPGRLRKGAEYLVFSKKPIRKVAYYFRMGRIAIYVEGEPEDYQGHIPTEGGKPIW